MTKANLLWIDLEMTGLDAINDRIVEVGAIATDWDFNEIARYESGVKVGPALMKRRMVGEFWDKNPVARDALLAQNLANSKGARTVENELLAFVEQHFSSRKPIYLAGNSIWNDRRFIEHEWPRLDAKLHYRMLDVSAWKLVFENKFAKKFAKPEAHRAMSDIEGSMTELKYYLKKVKV
jgi:oligoribonuclease